MLRSGNAWLNLRLGEMLSWPGWPISLLAGSILCLVLGRSDFLMVVLTVQTSLDAAATKTLQAHVREEDARRHIADEARDAKIQETLDAVEAILIDQREQTDLLREQTDVIRDMLVAAKRRDRIFSKQNTMILTALSTHDELSRFLRKEVSSSVTTPRKTRRGSAASAPPKNGRANQKR